MRGRTTIKVDRRRPECKSRNHKAKGHWNRLDKVVLYSVKPYVNQKGYFQCVSEKMGLQTYTITKDEIAFIRFIYQQYGAGDYCIQTWGKGNSKGFRIFWDGIITNDRKFIRKKNTGSSKIVASVYEKDTFSPNANCHIGKYMKTKTPGVWHNF